MCDYLKMRGTTAFKKLKSLCGSYNFNCKSMVIAHTEVNNKNTTVKKSHAIAQNV